MIQKNQVHNAFGGALIKSGSAEFTIIGLPFDEKSSHRRGAAGGPNAVRKVATSASINSYTESQIDLKDDTSLRDAGNLMPTKSAPQYFEDISLFVEDSIKSKTTPIIIGGDHSVSYPAIRGAARCFDELNIIWLDAHPDIYDEYEGDKLSHACPLARVCELENISSLHQGGVRATSKKLDAELRRNNVNIYPIAKIDDMKGLKVEGPTYLTIDIDVLDPAFAPGVGNPVPGGISTRILVDLIHSFEVDLIGFDLVEVNPLHDPNSITAAAGAKVIMETIGSIVKRRQKTS